MHVHSPILHGQLKENKIGQITLIVWVLGRVEKKPKKGSKIEENFFSLTGLFFRPVAVPYPINKKYIFLTKSFKLLFILKVSKIHCDIVKNESARTKKLRGVGHQTLPPPACLGLKL